MAWFMLDDKLHSHRKVARAGVEAMGLWALAGSWCADQLTDGWVPLAIVRRLAGRRWRRYAGALVVTGLWVDEARGGEQGWRFVESDLWRFAVRVRQPIPLELRRAIYDRDGWRCLQCGSPRDLTLDHIWPWSLGGPDTLANLQTLCRSCNSRKGARVDATHPHHQA